MKMDVFYLYMSLRQNAKSIIAAFTRCTAIWGILIFQIDVNYKYTATPHENRKKSLKSYFKTMSSTIECLKKSASSKKPKSAYTDIMGKVEKTT